MRAESLAFGGGIMPTFRVQIGFELPFWLALPEREYAVAWQGGRQTLSINNSVDRVEVGDFYLGKEVRGVVWCQQAEGERVRTQLQRSSPGMPITRHALKSVVTHVREVEADTPGALGELYEQQREQWVDETLQIVNRLLDAYTLAALNDRIRGEAGRVAYWDIGFVLVSFLDEHGRQPLLAHMQPVRARTPRPEPFDAKRQLVFERLIDWEDEYPLPDLLSISAWSHILRGNYRAAILDDFNAIELAVADLVRELAAERSLPSREIGRLLHLRFDDICRNLLPVVGGPKLTLWDKWPRVKKAQDIRHKVVHRGAHATRADANIVHDAAILTLTHLTAWLPLKKHGTDEGPAPEAEEQTT
jgi:hypothetical protein